MSEWLWSVLIDWNYWQDLSASHSRPKYHNRPIVKRDRQRETPLCRPQAAGLGPGHITSAWMEFVSPLLVEVLTLSLQSAGICLCRSLCWQTSVNTCNALQEQNWSLYQVGVSYLCQYISTWAEKQGGWQVESKRGGKKNDCKTFLGRIKPFFEAYSYIKHLL